jgi:hypothetical protein
LQVTIHVSLHKELISALIYIHLDCAKDPTDSVVRKLNEYFADIAVLATGKSRDDKWLKKRHNFLFDMVWKIFFRDHKALPSPFGKRDSYPPALANPKPDVKLNFRGILIARGTASTSESNIDKERIALSAESLAPLLCCANTGKPTLRIEDLGISTMMEDRAVHLTTLGHSSSGDYDKNNHRYVMYWCPPDREDLGTLINLGHELGICRIMAIQSLPDLEKLETAEDHLRQIETEMHFFVSESDSENPSLSRRIILGNFQQVGRLFGGNIHFNINQSIRYTQRMDDIIDSYVKVRNIGKFKSYKTKSTEIAAKVSRSTRIVKYYDRLLRDFQEARSLAGIEESAKQNRELTNLQRVAEILLFFPLVPYYFGHLLTETFHSFHAESPGYALWKLPDAYLWGFSIALGAGLLIRKWLFPDWKPQSIIKLLFERLRTHVVFVLTTLLLLGLLLANFWLLLNP